MIDFHSVSTSARQSLFTVVGALVSMMKTSAEIRLENSALRQQLAVLRSAPPESLKLDARRPNLLGLVA